MPDAWVIAGYVLIPLGFGLVPGLLPTRMPPTVRWSIWLALLAISAAYVASIKDRPEPFPWLVLVPFWLSSLLSLYLLIAEAGRVQSRRSRARPGP